MPHARSMSLRDSSDEESLGSSEHGRLLGGSDEKAVHAAQKASASLVLVRTCHRLNRNRLWIALVAAVATFACTFSSSIALSTRRTSERCNPFLARGTFIVDDSTSLTGRRWQPFDPKCTHNHMWPDLVEAVTSGKDKEAIRQQFPWLVGRTLVKIGDSVDFCSTLRLQAESITPDHPMSVPDWAHPLDRPRPAESKELYEWGRPTRCRIDSLDFELVQFFMYGLGTVEEHNLDTGVTSMLHYYTPVSFTDRVTHIVLPMLQKMGRHADLVEYNSHGHPVRPLRRSVVDIRSFIFELDKVFAADPSITPLWTNEQEKGEWYRARLETALDSVERAFPSSQLIWRRPHDIAPGNPSRSVSRNAQLRHISDDVIADRPRFRIDNIGGVLDGQLEDFQDGFHPGLKMSSNWADIMLYELRTLANA